MRKVKLSITLPANLAARLKPMDDLDAFAALALERALPPQGSKPGAKDASADRERPLLDPFDGKPEYRAELIDLRKPQESEDELFDEAVELVLREGAGSSALLQRAFSVGYARATKLIDAMRRNGILGPHRGSQARGVLITQDAWKTRHRNAPPP